MSGRQIAGCILVKKDGKDIVFKPDSCSKLMELAEHDPDVIKNLIAFGCHNDKLEETLASISNKIEYLYINGGGILGNETFVTNNVLIKMKSLKQLVVEWARHDIPSEVFKELTNLEYINIINNNIPHELCSHLKTFKSTSWTTLSDSVFSNNDTIEIFWIAYTNASGTCLETCTNIRELFINSLQLKHILKLPNLNKLTRVYVIHKEFGSSYDDESLTIIEKLGKQGIQVIKSLPKNYYAD